MTPTLGRITFFIPEFGIGGVERMSLAVGKEFVSRGFEVDILAAKVLNPAFASDLSTVNLIDLGCRRTLAAIGPIASYLSKVRPIGLISALPHGNLTAAFAKRI